MVIQKTSFLHSAFLCCDPSCRMIFFPNALRCKFLSLCIVPTLFMIFLCSCQFTSEIHGHCYSKILKSFHCNLKFESYIILFNRNLSLKSSNKNIWNFISIRSAEKSLKVHIQGKLKGHHPVYLYIFVSLSVYVSVYVVCVYVYLFLCCYEFINMTYFAYICIKIPSRVTKKQPSFTLHFIHSTR